MTGDTAMAAIDGVTGAATRTLQISEAGMLVAAKGIVRLGSNDDESGGSGDEFTRSRSMSPRLPHSPINDVGRVSTAIVEAAFSGASGAVAGMGDVSKSVVRGSASAL